MRWSAGSGPLRPLRPPRLPGAAGRRGRGRTLTWRRAGLAEAAVSARGRHGLHGRARRRDEARQDQLLPPWDPAASGHRLVGC